jgi:heat shock protein HslJ
MKARIGFLALVALATSLALAGCAGSSSGAGSPSTAAHATVGSWGSEKQGEPSLTIAEDGAFNGTDGCNSLSGRGTFEGDTFALGTFASTMMACPGVDTWMSKASTATADGDKLVVKDAAGTEIGTLDKR